MYAPHFHNIVKFSCARERISEISELENGSAVLRAVINLINLSDSRNNSF